MKKRSAVIVLCSVFCVLCSSLALAESAYPQIDISGFKKWENKKVEIDPANNYFAGLTQLGGFYPTFSGGPWQERLQLRILGQLSEDLSVTYDLEQQPETPEKFDVKVKYYNNELTFGDLTANFSGNEFVSTSKYLNGVMLTAKDTWYDIVTVPSAKLKSQTQALTSQKGNNSKGPYNLGHGSIVEGTEQVQMNGLTLTKNVDYTVDYFEGKITFNRILNSTDEFKYSYEYTNVLDLFFPSLSKRDFFGFQSRFTIDPEKFGQPAPKEEPVITMARDVFPSAGSVEPEVQEEEASGRYRLRFAPLVKFSEVLTFMGTQLKKNEDYIIRYDTGELKLLTRFMPSSEEALSVESRYYVTSQEVEMIPGIGSRGPYRTRNKRLVPESERLEVDSKLFVRDLDYTINYETGEILFGVVLGPTSQIKANYRYNAMAFPPSTPSKFPKELKLGATYLKESAKKGGGSPTASVIESATGSSLISNNYLLNLKNRPVLPTSEANLTVLLKQGGISRPLTQEVDFTIPTTDVDPVTGFIRVTPPVSLGYITDRNDPTDGYGTGTLYFYNNILSLEASDEVTVTYTYKKSIVGKYSGVGDGSRGPYYLRNIRQIVPGSETLQVWDQGSSVITTYTRNGSFESNAGDTGYAINYNADSPALTFNKELAPAKNFQLIYQYVAPQSTGSDDISQVAYGFDGSFKIGDAFKVDSSYARSETDQVYTSVTTAEPPIIGNGTKNYQLHSPATIIDASEQLYVNNQLLNRDIDYFISYTAPGAFNFYYITPATQDVISVQYNYQSSEGPISQTKVKSDSAFRLGAETRLFGDIFTAGGSTKKIGFDFSPLGGTAIGVGSEYDEYNLSFKPPVQSFFTNYSYKVNKNPLGSSRQTFTYSYDNSLSTGINPGGLAQFNVDYRTLATIDDPLAAGALHNNDNQQESYAISLVPAAWSRGVLGYSQKYDYRKTTSKTDVIDRGANKSTQNIDYYHASGNLKFTDRIGAGYDFQYNEPLTLGSDEAKTAHNRILDNAYNLNLDLTMLFLQKWTARVSLLNHDELKLVPIPEAAVSTKNETYHMDVTPFSMLAGSLDHNRQERTAYTAGQENPMSERTAAGTRLSPFSWFSVGGNYSRSLTIPETGALNKTTGRSKAGDIDFTPISFNALKLNSRFATSDTLQTAPSGSEMVSTQTNTLSQNYTLNVNIIPILPITCGLNVESYKNYNSSLTSPVSTETENQTVTANTTLTIPMLPQLSLNGDYNQKITKNLKTGDSRPKTMTNTRASYQVFSWGTLNYEIADEINKGEVQSGSVVDLDLKKTTTTISLNITIPVDNPVLSNFNVLASLKQVDYINNQNHGDDFKAKLISFEGTMNF
ncbi:MAG: hypothetical protein WC632_03705 [Candidatus Margulisiibacteriota bacterium]